MNTRETRTEKKGEENTRRKTKKMKEEKGIKEEDTRDRRREIIRRKNRKTETKIKPKHEERKIGKDKGKEEYRRSRIQRTKEGK